jgi:hypothetical protein
MRTVLARDRFGVNPKVLGVDGEPFSVVERSP